MRYLPLIISASLIAAPITHAKQQFDTGVVVAAEQNKILNTEKIIIPVKSDGRLYNETIFSFDTRVDDTPTIMAHTDTGLCWIASARNVSGSYKLTISKSPSGYFLLGGSLDGKTLISGTNVAGTAICAVKRAPKAGDPDKILPPSLSASCSNTVGKNCYGSKSGNPPNDISAEVTINAQLQNCPGCSIKFTKLSGNFDLLPSGNSAKASKKRVGTAPGKSSADGLVRVDLVAPNKQVITSKTKNIELHAQINEPSLSINCKQPSCSATASTNYGIAPIAVVDVKSSFANCTNCYVRLSKKSGDISLESSLPAQAIKVTRNKNSIGTTSRSGEVLATLKAPNGTTIKTASRTVSVEAKVTGSPRLATTCNPCSDNATQEYGTTAKAKATVDARFYECASCYVRFIKESGDALQGKGNSRYLSVTQPGNSAGTSKKSATVRVELVNSDGNVVSSNRKVLSASAGVKEEVRLVTPNYYCKNGYEKDGQCKSTSHLERLHSCKKGYTYNRGQSLGPCEYRCTNYNDSYPYRYDKNNKAYAGSMNGGGIWDGKAVCGLNWFKRGALKVNKPSRDFFGNTYNKREWQIALHKWHKPSYYCPEGYEYDSKSYSFQCFKDTFAPMTPSCELGYKLNESGMCQAVKGETCTYLPYKNEVTISSSSWIPSGVTVNGKKTEDPKYYKGKEVFNNAYGGYITYEVCQKE